MAQWLGVCLLVQGMRVRALVWEDPTCRRAAGPVGHNCWACASGAVLRNRRGRDGERPAHRDEEWPPLATTREGPSAETKTQHSNQSINQNFCLLRNLLKIKILGNSLAVQWLGLCASTARGPGSIPGRETKKIGRASCRERV